jgi:hypothetical protein
MDIHLTAECIDINSLYHFKNLTCISLFWQDTDKVISMKTLIIKSLLTSLYQREGNPLLRGVQVCVIPLFGKEGRGEIFQ